MMSDIIPESDIAGDQILGERDRQEDYYAYVILDDVDFPIKGLLGVLADGMGGHAAGDQASKIAVETFADVFLNSKDTPIETFKNALKIANEKIGELSHRIGKECGCTILSFLIFNNNLIWISVGDSSLMLVRNGNIVRLNQDHSMRASADKMFADGKINDAERVSLRNVLESALSGEKIEKIDIKETPFELKKSDILIAASDGIESISHDDLLKILESASDASPFEKVSAILCGIENSGNPNQDNTTIMLTEIK